MSPLRWLLLCGVATLPSQLHAVESSEWNFSTQILPILTKSGCNAGACHGAATGQGGFSLSLLGYDAAHDHAAITRELGGRRIDLADPARSLLLRKATRTIKHKGGRKFTLDSAHHATLRDFVQLKYGCSIGRRSINCWILIKVPFDVAPS